MIRLKEKSFLRVIIEHCEIGRRQKRGERGMEFIRGELKEIMHGYSPRRKKEGDMDTE